MKSVKIKVLDKEFLIRARYKDLDCPIWDKENYHNKYSITVINLNNNKRIWFYFWDSLINTQENKKLSEIDLIYAFKCFLEDALNYIDYNIDEFQKEFGYDNITLCLNAYDGCRKSYLKTIKLGLTEDDLYNIVNAIIEKENEDKLLDLIVG